MSDFNWNDYPEDKGFSGIARDVGSSLATLPGALADLLYNLPGEAYSSGEQVITNPKRAASNFAGGLMKGMRGMVNAPANINDYLREKQLSSIPELPQVVPTGLEQMLLSGNEPGDALLRGAGEFLPGGFVGRGAKGLSGLAQRAGGAGLVATGSGELDPIHAAMTSLLGEGIGKAGQSAYEATFSGKPKVLKGIEHGDVAKTVAAANRLELPYVTPGEASGFGYVGKQEGKIGNTLEGSKLREKRARERSGAEEAAIVRFLDQLDDRVELPKEKKRLYDSVMTQELPAEFLGPYASENPVVASAVKLIETKPAYKQRLMNVEPNTFGYWDEIKRVLYDMESAEKRRGKNNLAQSIAETRRKLIDRMDEIEPNYEKARKLGQRTILRHEIEQGFDKKDMTGPNFYRNVIQSKSKFQKLYDDLSEFPEMQQTLTDMELVFPKLYGESNAKAAVKGERSGYETPRADIAWLLRFAKQKFNESGDVRAVEAITSDWLNKLRDNNVSTPGRSISPAMQEAIQLLIKSEMTGEQSNE